LKECNPMDFVAALREIRQTPLPTILVMAGIFFFFLAVGGQIRGQIPAERHKWAISIGSVLLVLGLGLFFIPAPSPTSNVQPPTGAALPTPALPPTAMPPTAIPPTPVIQSGGSSPSINQPAVTSNIPTTAATLIPTALPVPSPSALPATATQSALLTEIESNQGWQDTGVELMQGGSFHIEYVSGTWTYWPGTIVPLDANGDNYICSAAFCCEPLPHGRKGALIGKIGEDVFFVGNGGTLTANASGNLFLRINDCDTALVENVGSVKMRIMR
jgi:hypothetical protein